MEFDYSLLSFITRGQRRKKVLKTLTSAKIPKDIAKECELSISNVSLALSELMKKGLVKCVNPEDHLHKFHQLTEKGKSILKQLEEYEKIN